MNIGSDIEGVRECWAETGGCRMRFLETGECTERPPLLLIHGLLGYSFSWRFNLAELARETQVLAVDLPGVGFSQRKPDLDCRLHAMAQRLHEFLRERGYQAVDVLGTSHGGGLALVLAALAQKAGMPRVRRLVLSAPVNPWSGHGQLITRVLTTRAGSFAFRRCELLVRCTHGWALRRMYGDPARVRPGALEGYREPLEIPGTLDHVLRIVNCWHQDLAEIESSVRQIADIPTLLLWGSRDGAVLPESADKLKTKLRNAELVVFAGAGHLPYEEMPDEFNGAVMEFLGRVGDNPVTKAGELRTDLQRNPIL